MTKIFSTSVIIICLIMLGSASESKAQGFVVGKYGDDFMSVGGGSRALAMGSAHTAAVNDVTAGYWNPAALAFVKGIEGVYMHSERFSGIVGYDYGAVALPMRKSDGVLALSLFRQGVDGIKNTLDAWNEANGQPLPNPTDRFSEFSAYDLGFLLSYAQPVNETSSWGTSLKIINSSIGPFAEAWGFSLDIGIYENTGNHSWGIMVQNATLMYKYWQVNRSTLEKLESFGDLIPEGQNEKILPVAKMGYAYRFNVSDFDIVTAFDTDLRFDNRQTYYMNWGKMSFEPHFGLEVGYKDVVFLRGGLTDVYIDDNQDYTTSATMGAGISFRGITIDYGLASVTGISSDLGFTHRISLKFALDRFNQLPSSEN
jgi:hypothetical protein